MWFYIKLAWRNIFRNKRRTFISSLAIGIGLGALIFVDAWMQGMNVASLRSTTSSFLGEAQIHHPQYRQTQEVGYLIQNKDRLMNILKENGDIQYTSPRTLCFGMVSSPADMNGVMVVGINPETEQRISKIDDALVAGQYFENGGRQDIIMGKALAEVLEVSLGDRVVVTVAQADGKLSQEMFRISGLFQFGVKDMDKGMVFIMLPKAREMLGIGEGIHQVVIKFKDIDMASDKSRSFWGAVSGTGNEAVSWGDLLPQLKAFFEMTGMIRGVMLLIVFFVVVFGIINTLFMSLYERLFEFGVLRAVGTRPGGVGKLMLFEAGALGVLSMIIGILIGLLLTFVFLKVGTDYRGLEFAGTAIQEIVYPVMKWYQYVFYPAGIVIFTFLVGLYPAVVAARMSISEALRKSL